MINYVDLNGARTLKNKILEEIDSTYQKKRDVVNINIAVFDSDGGLTDANFRIATDEEVEAYLNSVLPI